MWNWRGGIEIVQGRRYTPPTLPQQAGLSGAVRPTPCRNLTLLFLSLRGGRNDQVLITAVLCFITSAVKPPRGFPSQGVPGPRICITSQLPHEADAVGLGAPRSEPLV